MVEKGKNMSKKSEKERVERISAMIDTNEDFQKIIKFHKRMNSKSMFSDAIKSIEVVIEKALKRKVFEQMAFLDYKTLLYRHFMELEGIEFKED